MPDLRPTEYSALLTLFLIWSKAKVMESISASLASGIFAMFLISFGYKSPSEAI
jgi:hypothetical protein